MSMGLGPLGAVMHARILEVSAPSEALVGRQRREYSIPRETGRWMT